MALRTLAQQLSKLIPIAGMPISAGIAGAATYGLGRAAEAYFLVVKSALPKSSNLTGTNDTSAQKGANLALRWDRRPATSCLVIFQR